LSYLAADLKTCIACGQTVCDKHSRMCAACGKPVCQRDARTSRTGEVLCPSHAGQCDRCPPENAVHRVAALATCAVGHEKLCAEHRVDCEICQRTTVCHEHAARLKKCASCGRTSCGSAGCSAESTVCRECGIHYCSRCVSSATGKSCPACSQVAQKSEARIDAAGLATLQQLRGQISGEDAQVIDAMLAASEHIRTRQDHNRSYYVQVYRCRLPRLQQIWRLDFALNKKQLRVVYDSNKRVVSVRSETAID